MVHGLSKGLAGLEMWNQLFGNGHALTRAGISAHAWRASIDRESPKAPELNTVALDQSNTHGIQERLHRRLGIRVSELSKPRCELGHQIASCHEDLEKVTRGGLTPEGTMHCLWLCMESLRVQLTNG